MASDEVEVRKVLGEENLADGITKPMGRRGIEKHRQPLTTGTLEWRHERMPEVESVEELIAMIHESEEKNAHDTA